MHHATDLNLPAPSTQTLTFGKTQLRPSFARDFTPAMQRDLAVTTAYALLKFGLSGCATSSDNTGIFLPTDNPVQVDAERRTHDHLPPTDVDTASRGTQTITIPSYATAPKSFAQQMLTYLADRDTNGDVDVPALYAKTYNNYPHDAGLRCFPASLLDFDPCHKAMWSAAYDNNLRVTVLKERTQDLQTHVHNLESSIYGAYTVACIAQKHASLAQPRVAITTLPSSPWNLWEAILTGAGLRPLGYSIAHVLTLMAQSSHPDIVAKICGETAWRDVAWSHLGGGHYLNEDDFAPILVHLAELILEVKIFVYKPSSDHAWELKELTWTSTGELTPVHLLPTIDPRLAHKT
jgi:hypothetical protein